MPKAWIYHKTEDPQIIEDEDMEKYEKKGWKDSPRYFVKTTDFNVDPDDVTKVQQLGEAIEGVKDALNDALNLKDMTAKELLEYSKNNFDVKLKGKTKALRVAEIELIMKGELDG